jgi:hypothetical protein
MPIISVTNGLPVSAFAQPSGNDCPGTEIGLTVKRFAGRHGGRLWMQRRVAERVTYRAALWHRGGAHV